MHIRPHHPFSIQLLLFLSKISSTTCGSAPISIPRPPPSWSSSSSSTSSHASSRYTPYALKCDGQLPAVDFYGWPAGYMPSDFRSVEELCAYEPGRTHTLGTICLNPVAERSSHVCDRGLADEALWESEPLQRFCWASCYCSEDAVSDQDRQTLRERLNYARMLGDKPRSEDYEYPSDAETEDDYPSRQYEGTVYANSATALDLWWVRLTKGRSRANTRVCAPGTRGRKCASPRRPSAVVRQGQLTKALTAESTIQGICGIKCQRRRDGSLGCAGSVAGACACAAVWVGTGLWDLGGCRHKIGGGSRGKRDEGAWACPCNATYVSAGCCGNTDGVVYEAAEMRLGRLI